MKLYHFTSLYHLPRILEAGYLKTVESNVSLETAHYAPDVVWLTDQEIIAPGTHGLESSVDKTRIRFTVDVEAEKWRDFANRYGIDKHWYRALDATGGYTAKHWWVIARPVVKKEWIEVTNMRGDVLLP